jgi:hypothetical protein
MQVATNLQNSAHSPAALLPEPLRVLARRAKASLQLTRWRLSGRPWGYPLPSGGLVNEPELRQNFRNALSTLKQNVGADNIGDYLEFGVYRGSSLLLMYDELLRAELNQIRLLGFDSFAGLPSDEENFWGEGTFSADYDMVVRSLNERNIDWKRVSLTKGFFSDTLTDELIAKHNLRKISLIMIDCDLYSGAKEALDFCAPFIHNEAIIIFDDWNPLAKENKGEKRAFDEFLQANPDLEAEAISEYSWQPGDLQGKVFRVRRS